MPSATQVLTADSSATSANRRPPGPPTAREVVAKLAINPNTVLKAYRELERERLVGARPGQGTFVLRALPGPDSMAVARFSQELGTWLGKARAAGFGPDDIEAIYQAAMRNCFSEGVA
jgi:GntR family transcriptional regulator